MLVCGGVLVPTLLPEHGCGCEVSCAPLFLVHGVAFSEEGLGKRWCAFEGLQAWLYAAFCLR